MQNNQISENPKMSIITVCYNSDKTIKDTIESVLSQSYTNIEYIIIDGASKDKTMEIIDTYSERIQKIICEPDKGLWDAMNKGIEVCSGDFIGFLNSDDFFVDNDTVSNMVTCLIENQADGAFGFVDIVDRENVFKIIRRYRVSTYSKFTFQLGMMPAHPGFFAHHSFFKTLGAFRLDSDTVAPDFELMVRFLMKGKIKAALYPKPIIKMRNDGISNKKFTDRIFRYKTLVASCRTNGLHTLPLLMLLKIPYKFYEYIRRS